MDVMMPRLKQQASPAPWLLRLERQRLPSLIERVLESNPDATINEVVAQLGDRGVQASGIIVGMWMSHRKRLAVEPDIDSQRNLAERRNTPVDRKHDRHLASAM